MKDMPNPQNKIFHFHLFHSISFALLFLHILPSRNRKTKEGIWHSCKGAFLKERGAKDKKSRGPRGYAEAYALSQAYIYIRSSRTRARTTGVPQKRSPCPLSRPLVGLLLLGMQCCYIRRKHACQRRVAL